MDQVQSRTDDPVEALIEFLTPAVIDILRRIDAEEFTTPQFIEVMQSDPAAAAAYEEAVRRWGEQTKQAKMVVHGQVIPLILRRSNLVEWAGYAHGEEDEYAVPAWWTLRSPVVEEALSP
ncbi:MAG: hypothetical protein M3R06_03260 [Chloroflexota bacterium]|nr:hypothetical protein [Chloroflexota bacterium]